jgi:hypothetical protein
MYCGPFASIVIENDRPTFPKKQINEFTFYSEHEGLPHAFGFFFYLLGLLFDHEDAGDMLLRNFWLFSNHTTLQPRRTCLFLK